MSSSLNIMEGTRQYPKNLQTTCIERVFIIVNYVRAVQSRNRKTDFYFCQSKSIKMEMIQTETAREHLNPVRNTFFNFTPSTEVQMAIIYL
jgi:hypothetical protein